MGGAAQERNGGMWAEKKQESARRGRLGQVERCTRRGHLWLRTLPPPCAGGWARASGRCPTTLAGTWTHVPSHLCGHQLSEPCSAPAAATGASCAVLGKDTNPAI